MEFDGGNDQGKRYRRQDEDWYAVLCHLLTLILRQTRSGEQSVTVILIRTVRVKIDELGRISRINLKLKCQM